MSLCPESTFNWWIEKFKNCNKIDSPPDCHTTSILLIYLAVNLHICIYIWIYRGSHKSCYCTPVFSINRKRSLILLFTDRSCGKFLKNFFLKLKSRFLFYLYIDSYSFIKWAIMSSNLCCSFLNLVNGSSVSIPRFIYFIHSPFLCPSSGNWKLTCSSFTVLKLLVN